MAEFALWIGYAVMTLGAFAALTALVFLATYFAWEQMKRVRGITKIWSAVRSADERHQEIVDAARYRWLKNRAMWSEPGGSPWVVNGTGHADAVPLYAGEMDEAVDAAIAADGVSESRRQESDPGENPR